MIGFNWHGVLSLSSEDELKQSCSYEEVHEGEGQNAHHYVVIPVDCFHLRFP